MTPADPLWSDRFHNAAFRAWAEIYEETGQWPPDRELTRRRACEIFEREKRVDRGEGPR
jgi:hypothetical protein